MRSKYPVLEATTLTIRNESGYLANLAGAKSLWGESPSSEGLR